MNSDQLYERARLERNATIDAARAAWRRVDGPVRPCAEHADNYSDWVRESAAERRNRPAPLSPERQAERNAAWRLYCATVGAAWVRYTEVTGRER